MSLELWRKMKTMYEKGTRKRTNVQLTIHGSCLFSHPHDTDLGTTRLPRFTKWYFCQVQKTSSHVENYGMIGCTRSSSTDRNQQPNANSRLDNRLSHSQHTKINFHTKYSSRMLPVRHLRDSDYSFCIPQFLDVFRLPRTSCQVTNFLVFHPLLP